MWLSEISVLHFFLTVVYIRLVVWETRVPVEMPAWTTWCIAALSDRTPQGPTKIV